MSAFPVKVPYVIGPNMNRNSGPVFHRSPNARVEKIKEIERFDQDLYATTHESSINQLVRKASRYCELETETDSIVELAMNLEEDVAIMHKGILAAICFCYPSSWIPRERIGQPLHQIHTPVADSDRLVKASPRIAETMADVDQGSFIRYVWTITNTPGKSQHPGLRVKELPQSIDDLYFRVETQTTAALGDNVSSLFFVNVSMTPLSEIWSDTVKSTAIVDSINSMRDSVVEYKNLGHIKTLLNKSV